MKFHPRLAPIKAAIFPLVNKDGMPEMATKLYRELKAALQRGLRRQRGGGRRYRRQDEIGTPFCITIDGDTHEGRHRDDPRPRHVAAAASEIGGREGGDFEGVEHVTGTIRERIVA